MATKPKPKCECSDPGCPSCHGHCDRNAKYLTVVGQTLDGNVAAVYHYDCRTLGVVEMAHVVDDNTQEG